MTHAPSTGKRLRNKKSTLARTTHAYTIIREVNTEKDRMIMWALIRFPILPTMEKTERPFSFPQTLCKTLPILNTQTSVSGQMRSIVRQRDKAITLVQLRLMNASNRPLARAFNPAANTLTARQRKGAIAITLLRVKDDRPTRSTISSKWPKTRHRYKRQPPRIGRDRRFLPFTRVPLRKLRRLDLRDICFRNAITTLLNQSFRNHPSEANDQTLRLTRDLGISEKPRTSQNFLFPTE